MSKHRAYLGYVLRHKWFVLLAGIKYRVPFLQLLVHDWSKFLPGEWRPYAEWFYGNGGGGWHPVLKDAAEDRRLGAVARNDAFLAAFVLHLHRSPHHWQHWILTPDAVDRPTRAFEMPERYAREMVADWAGAGRAITGRWETAEWYLTRGPREKLHPATRAFVERLLGVTP